MLTNRHGKLLIVLTLIVSMIGLVGCSDDENSTKKYNVSGTVVSNDGQALVGVTVKGGNTTTATNTDGELSLTGIKENKVVTPVDTDDYTFDGSHKVTADKSGIEFKAKEDKVSEDDGDIFLTVRRS